jgi:uncharacterized protein YbbC (DUF1343 family)
MIVLDRPNPIGGLAIEGPALQPAFESFVGLHPLPIRHGMTLGELARFFQAERRLDLDLQVIPCAGWTRAMHWPDTHLPWVMPSPNMPAYETALVYPGGCLIEGTNLSEGRGTTRPFELWGASWLDTRAFPRTETPPPGVLLRPASFRPTFHKQAGRLCHGIQPHVVDPHAFMPVRLYTAFLLWARAVDPDRFAWRTQPYEFVGERPAIDLLFGNALERPAIEQGDIHDRESAWRDDETTFAARRAPYLLYT